ncbi:MAG: cation:proton antiporter [Bacteroidetes bacterium]|nr:cation:proton antiporter [Bacteroidota bacterium]
MRYKGISLLISLVFFFGMTVLGLSQKPAGHGIQYTVKIENHESLTGQNSGAQHEIHATAEEHLTNDQSNDTGEEVQEHDGETGEVHEGDHGSGGGHGGMEPLFFIIIALIIGAATRNFFQKIPLPFTVLLLIFGIILGLLDRLWLHEWGNTISNAIEWAGRIDPHLILFVFLPTLIFEAAYAMDVHTFKKTSTNAIILAIPGILIAMFLTAFLIMAIDYLNIGLDGWGNFSGFIALMFGAVISATDPVAVVALLKELGASKKLGHLIEGESMLNDGTAIVIFMVFYTPLAIGAAGNPVVEFGKVALGGTLLGLIIGGVTLAWVKRVFNDALIEITVIVSAAYAAFFVAESFLHVSGVLALVALGLTMAGVGKTRISPEVQHFLHEFWELAAFFANTLIFIIVGVVIAQRTVFTASDFIILGIIYVGIHIVRAIVILVLFPFMRKTGYGLDRKNATVLWYGALRGAIGLALALVVAGISYSSIPEGLRTDLGLNADQFEIIKNQFLFLTAGIVTLTLLVNATTIKFVVNKLGLTKIAPAKALMILQANQYLRSSAENIMDKMKRDRFVSNANWSEVKEYLPKEVKIDIGESIKIETISEMRKRILEKEKSSYWHQFKEGLLGPTAVRRLSDGIDEMLDEGGLQSISHRKDLELLMRTPKLLSKLQSMPLLKSITRHMFFERLSVSYDCARGFVEAQEEAVRLVESMYRSLDPNDTEGNKGLSVIEGEINENKIEGLTFIRNLRKSYPEIYDAISTRQAIRSLLNYELKTVERLQKNGRIDGGEAAKMIHVIEERMKKLMQSPPKIKVPEADDFIKEIPWLNDLDPAFLSRMGQMFQNKIFAVGNKLIRQDGYSDGIFLIARGTVKVTHGDTIIDLVGEGSVIGEMAVLTGNPRTATVTAESPLTTFWMNAENLELLMKESPGFADRLWKIAGERFTSNILKAQEPYCFWRPKKFQKWLEKGRVLSLEPGEEYELKDEIGIIFAGKAKIPGSTTVIEAPNLLHVSKIKLANGGRIFLCEKIEE